jgi:hypothetical protein
MNQSDRRVAAVLTALVYAAFAALWFISFAIGKPPEFPVMYFWSAAVVALAATVWNLAARILYRAWRRQATATEPSLDAPTQALAAALAALRAGRSEWGQAMATELRYVEGFGARWRFALGCLWASIFLDFCLGGAVLATALAAILAAGATHEVVGHAFPQMQIFATVFLGLVGSIGVQTVARSGRFRAPRTTLASLAVGGLAVGACVIATGYFLAENPGATAQFPPAAESLLAAILAGAAWLIVAPPVGLTTHRWGRALGAAGGLVLAGGFVVASRASIHTLAGPIIWNLFAPGATLFAVSAAGAVVARSFRAGVQAAFWGTLLGTLLIYAATLPEAMHRFAIDGRTLGDGESGLPIGVNLADAIWSLFQIPISGFPFGVFGAALGDRWRRTRASRRDADKSPPPLDTLWFQWPRGGK